MAKTVISRSWLYQTHGPPRRWQRQLCCTMELTTLKYHDRLAWPKNHAVLTMSKFSLLPISGHFRTYHFRVPLNVPTWKSWKWETAIWSSIQFVYFVNIPMILNFQGCDRCLQSSKIYCPLWIKIEIRDENMKIIKSTWTHFIQASSTSMNHEYSHNDDHSVLRAFFSDTQSSKRTWCLSCSLIKTWLYKNSIWKVYFPFPLLKEVFSCFGSSTENN